MAYRTRADIEAAFTLDADGQIVNPGKYEGEYLYVPYFDTLANEGDGESRYPQCQCTGADYGVNDCECQAWDYFKVDTEEREMFAPYLDEVENVWLWVDSQGFTIIKTNTDEATLRREYHGIVDTPT